MSYVKTLTEKKAAVFVCETERVEFHTHEFLELVYVLKGEAEHFLDGQSQLVKEGDYFVIDYSSTHSYRAKTGDFKIINCLFMPEIIDPSLMHCKSLQAVISNYQIHFKNEFFTANPNTSVFYDDDGAVLLLLSDMLKEFEKNLPGYLQIVRSKLIELLILTMRKIYYVPQLAENNNDMDAIVAYINDNYMNSIKLKELCAVFNYTVPYLSMKFKKRFGITYKEYIQKMRVEHSLRLLAHTNMSVEDIAYSVGYKDIKAFYTVFKKFSSTTPASFRKNYKNL